MSPWHVLLHVNVQPNLPTQQQKEYFLSLKKSSPHPPAAGQIYWQVLQRNEQYCKEQKKKKKRQNLFALVLAAWSWDELLILLALFPAPTQLSVACLERAWERDYHSAIMLTLRHTLAAHPHSTVAGLLMCWPGPVPSGKMGEVEGRAQATITCLTSKNLRYLEW